MVPRISNHNDLDPLRLHPVKFMEGVEAWSCSGTPVDCVKLGIDKAEIRRRNFVKAEQFPYTTGFGWALDRALAMPIVVIAGSERGR